MNAADGTCESITSQSEMLIHGASAESLFRLACMRQAQGDIDGAGDALDALIDIDPASVQAWSNRGILHLIKDQPGQAAACLRQAAELAPTEARIVLNLGVAIKSQGDLVAAVEIFERAIALEDGLTMAHVNLCTTLQSLGRVDSAIEAGQRATQLAPELALAHNNLATALQRAGRHDEARTGYERAAKLAPDWHLPWLNLGELSLLRDDAEDAISNFRQCVLRQPHCAEAHFDLSLALLQRGEFTEGWQEYEWRWGGPTPTSPPTGVDAPFWNGQALEGSVILLYTEQGIGDNIQFIRFAGALQRRGGTVWVRAPATLGRLFQTCDGVARVIVEGERLPGPVDYQLPLMSVPRVLGNSWTSELGTCAYLSAPGELGPAVPDLRRPRLRSIGIVWSGNPHFVHNAERSCNAADFMPLCRIPGLHIVSLQHGERARDLAALRNLEIVDLSDRMGDFSDTADIIQQLDLVISVDTSIPHLAAALGKPVWLLLHSRPDWRWMRHFDRCMWYPTMRLFRQSAPGEWSGVFKRIQMQLSEWVNVGEAAP